MEEEDTCRICRSGAEEDMPLYHPCKCSGSIAKVHQDCLIEWLQHSKKKSCELCNTELRFHKVYSPSMPAELPFYLYLRRGLIQYLHLLRFTVRAGLVCALWLALLPLGNIYVWRLHLWIVDIIVWGLVGGVPPASRSSSVILGGTARNDTQQANSTATTTLLSGSILAPAFASNFSTSTSGLSFGIPFPLLVVEKAVVRILNHADYDRVLETLARDIFEGQMLTCAVVVFFVAIFLLREWCLQNLPQQVEGLGLAAVPAQNGNEPAGREEFLARMAAMRQNVDAHEAGLVQARAALARVDDGIARAGEPLAQDTSIERVREQVAALEQQVGANEASLARARAALAQIDDLVARAGEDDDGVRRPGDVVALREEIRMTMTGVEEDLANTRAALTQSEEDVGGTDHAADQPASSRPRLQHVVPDPPELQERAHDRGQGLQGTEGDDSDNERDMPPSLDEMRRRRAERFGSSTPWPSAHDDTLRTAEASSPRIDKGKAREDASDESSGEFSVGEEKEHSDAGKGKAKQVDFVEESLENGDLGSVNEAEKGPHEHHMAGLPEWDTNLGDEKDEDGIWEAAVEQDERSESEDDAVGEEDEEEEEEEEGEEAEEAEEAEEQPAIPAAVPAVDQADAQAPDLLELQDWEDEPENGERLEDDLDGMMEAIGMRGPLVNLLTNMTMMFVLCSFVLATFVALPYLIGRVFGLGANLVKLVRMPAHFLRYFSDPIVDAIVIAAKRVLHNILSLFGSRFTVRDITLFLTNVRAISGVNQGATSTSTSFNVTSAASRLSDSLLGHYTSKTVSLASDQPPQLKEALEASVLSMIASLVSTGQHLHSSLGAFYTSVEAKTQGVGHKDKVFCVALGHGYWLVGLFIQKRLSDLYLRWNLRWLKSTVDQQLVVLKVLSFIILELAVFPWCCGFLLDVSLLPLWEGVTLSSRLALLRNKPLSVSFTHWSLGTLYMFGLAQFVANTRSIVRSGVLCFVRDAGDPNFHPIKDILERRSLEQLRKIGMSGVIYSGILAATMGVCSRIIYYIDRQALVLPLRWEMHQSLTTTGLEYVVIAIFLPHLIKTWVPGYMLKRGVKRWWKLVARQLRISSYLIGGRFPSEEGRNVRRTWKATLLLKTADAEASDEDEDEEVYFVKDGGYARVPADDHAIMSCPIVIRTDASGEPTSERGLEAVAAQEEAIAKLTKKPQYTVVYLPPHFRGRIIALFLALWATLSLMFIVHLLVPLVLGRTMLDAVLPSTTVPLHDGYSWFLGAFSIGLAVQGCKTARRMIKTSHPKRRALRLAKRGLELAWIAAAVSLTSCLLGITVELYINGLCRPFLATSTMLPDISLLHAWAMGMLLQHIVICILEMYTERTAQVDWATTPFTLAAFYAIMELRASNLRRPKVWMLTQKGFVPAALFYANAIAAPVCLLFFLQSLLGPPSTQTGRDARTAAVFAGCLCWIFYGLFCSIMARVRNQWTSLIKDELFLVSTELKNYASDSDTPVNGSTADGPIPEALLHPAQ